MGDSGINVNTIPLNKLRHELQTINIRQGLKSKLKMCQVQSIGIMSIAIADMKTAKPLRNIEEHATARAAVLAVWNSLTYENAPAWDPAKLKSIRYSINIFINFH